MGRPPLCPTSSFTELWEQCTSVHEVARRLGITSRQASVKAHYLRSQGVQLKHMGTGVLGARRIAHDKECAMMEQALRERPDISLEEYLRQRRLRA